VNYISQVVNQSERPKMQASIIRYKSLPSVVKIQVGDFYIEVCGKANLQHFQRVLKELGDHTYEALMSHDAYPKE